MDQTATGPDRIAVELAADLDAGFADLFEAHQNVLFSTALRICGRWANAEDLTAAAFLRAFRALAGYDRERIAGLRTRPWLLTILRRSSPGSSAPGFGRPLLPAARPAVAWELTANFARTSTYFAMLFVLAQYLQQGLGRSATYSGLVLVSWVAAYGVAAPVTRRLPTRAAPGGACSFLSVRRRAAEVSAVYGEEWVRPGRAADTDLRPR